MGYDFRNDFHHLEKEKRNATKMGKIIVTDKKNKRNFLKNPQKSYIKYEI